MATLDDLKDVLESIDNTMTQQKDLLTNMFTLQETMNTRQETMARLSSVNTSVSTGSIGSGIGAAAAGIGSGVGTAATGLGIGSILGLGALSMFANFDANKIKQNVVTLLSISDEVGGRVEFLKEGGSFFLAMSGLAAGLAAFGIGQTIVGLGQWITDDQWTQTLKSNVIDLLSIADDVGGNLSFLYEGGTVGLALGGLGTGLAAFGIGQTLTGLGQWITDTNWAVKVKENVKTLLSIKDDLGGAEVLFSTGAFPAAMIGLAVGLSAFSVGNAAVGLAQFISSDNWAEKVKNNVETLLSISDLPGIGWNTTGFIGVMAGIATGLAAFALGKGAATVVEGAAESIKFFTGDSFAGKIKSEVQTLLSIPQMEGVGADTAGFIGTMLGITAGLSAFALGKSLTATIDGASQALDYFTGNEPFAEKIKSEVATLLSIVDLAPEGSVDSFNNIMTKLRNGLSTFSGGNLVASLKNVGSAILNFFSGQESPFEQIRMIAEDSDKLVKAADAIQKIADSLEKFGSIKVNVEQVDFEKLARNLGESLPLLDKLANGGIYDPWGLGNKIDFKKGILDPNLKLDEMADAIAKVNYVLGRTTEIPSTSSTESNIKETASSMINEPDMLILTTHTEKMIELSQNILRSLEVIESAVGPQGGSVTAVTNSGNTDARSTVYSPTVTTVNNFSGKQRDDLDYGIPYGPQ